MYHTNDLDPSLPVPEQFFKEPVVWRYVSMSNANVSKVKTQTQEIKTYIPSKNM
jgi:hypothetical protein